MEGVRETCTMCVDFELKILAIDEQFATLQGCGGHKRPSPHSQPFGEWQPTS